MLAVFERSVARTPDALLLHADSAVVPISALKDEFLATKYSSARPGTVLVNFPSGFLAYSSHGQTPLFPRLFGVVDDIFCIFQGHIESIALLKQQYGLNKTANEVIIVIEAYRTLRDRGPYPAAQVMRDITGKFAFILFDFTSKSVFMASDTETSPRLFWGSDAEGNLVVSNEDEVVKQCCGKSFASFPKGCFFTSSGGLQSYEHPVSELKAVPQVDSSGELCGISFKVDEESRKQKTGMPRVGSDANWSGKF